MKTKLVAVVIIVGVFVSCNNRDYIRRMQEMEEGVSNPVTIEELKDAISKYNARVNDIMISQERIGIWYKILASRYFDKQMYKLAFDALQSAIEYYPGNKNLFFKAGVCAVQMGKSHVSFSQSAPDNIQRSYYYAAEEIFLRAIELDKNYDSAKMSLSVLYVFDLNEPEKAIPLLESIIQKETKPFDELFVVARAYIMTGEFQKAVDAYDQIIALSKSKSQRNDAEQNKKLVLEEMNK